MSTLEIPLFPLRTLLFPGGYLPLRIFEQGYLSLVRECARSDSGFGVCPIIEGEETIAFIDEFVRATAEVRNSPVFAEGPQAHS